MNKDAVYFQLLSVKNLRIGTLGPSSVSLSGMVVYRPNPGPELTTIMFG